MTLKPSTPSTDITLEEVEALFDQAKPAEMPSAPALADATAGMNWARRMFEAHSQAKGWATRWSRAAKDARALRSALVLFLDVGGEVRDRDETGKVVARLRPSGVWGGPTIDGFRSLLAALDENLPALEKHLGDGGPRQPQAKPQTAAVLRLWDLYLRAVTAGFPVVHRDLYDPSVDRPRFRPFPGRSKDGPAVRFICAALPVISARRMDVSAVASILQKHVKPPAKVRIGR